MFGTCPALRTEAVLALQLGSYIIWRRASPPLSRSGGGGVTTANNLVSLGAGMALVLLEVGLSGLLIRNTILSCAILPAQLTSRKPQWRLSREVYTRALSLALGISPETLVPPWAAAARCKTSFVQAEANSRTLHSRRRTAWISVVVWVHRADHRKGAGGSFLLV